MLPGKGKEMDIEIRKDYDTIKKDIKENIVNAARSFIYIGYCLKQVEEQKLYEIDGYADIHEFGLMEYGFSRSTTDRYIDINREFSVGGNSPEMLEDFQGCSISLLQELLPLTEEERQLFTEKSKREDIREYKKTKKEYERLEVIEEQKDEEIIQDNNTCAHAHSIENTNVISIFPTEENRVIQLLIRRMFGEQGQQKKRHEQLLEIQKYIISDNSVRNERIAEIINPNGNDTFKQPPVFLFLYDYKTGLKYRDFREQQSEMHIVTWDKFIELLIEVFDFTSQDPWIAYYGLEEVVNEENEIKKEQKNTNTTEHKVEQKTVVTIRDSEDEEEFEEDPEQEEVEAEIIEAESNDDCMAADCNFCENNTRIGQGDYNLQINHKRLQLFNNSGEVLMEIEINNCPMCGKEL